MFVYVRHVYQLDGQSPLWALEDHLFQHTNNSYTYVWNADYLNWAPYRESDDAATKDSLYSALWRGARQLILYMVPFNKEQVLHTTQV